MRVYAAGDRFGWVVLEEGSCELIAGVRLTG
jgi:hypothetical protein